MRDSQGFVQFATAEEFNPPPLLRLPTELRLRIFELAYNATWVNQKLKWDNRYGGFVLSLFGSQDYPGQLITTGGSPFNLVRVCRKLHHELASALPRIRDIVFEFNEFSERDMERWLGLMSDRQISQIRRFEMLAWSGCHLDTPPLMRSRSRPLVSCDRTIVVDLLGRELDETFRRNLGRSADRGITQQGKDHRKAEFLMNQAQGHAVIPASYTHPHDRISCYNWVALKDALGALVTNEGDIRITRDSLMQVRSAMLEGVGLHRR